MKTKSYPRVVRDNSSLYEAIVNNRWKLIRSLLKNKNVNDPVMTTGPLSGYTPLHIACMGTDHQLVELFLKTYKPDVNVVANDGTQPLQLVCLLESSEKLRQLRCRRLRALLEANANPNSEIRQETFLKLVKDKEWCPDFGNKMTLLTYAIVYNVTNVYELLLKFNANPKIISLTNKTLLMYALDNDSYEIAWKLADCIKDPEFMNHRDNDGIPTIYYMFHPKKFEKNKYTRWYSYNNTMKWVFHPWAFWSIIDAGADVHALINNDPSTFLFNIAAYRGFPLILETISMKNLSVPLFRGLYYVTLPEDENSNDDFNVLPENVREERLSLYRERRIECTAVIVKDLVNRRTFGLPVPKEEIELLDNLIVTNKDVRNIMNNYKKKFIEGELKKSFIEVGDRKMTLFDFIMEVFDDKKLKLLVNGIKDIDQFLTTWYKCYRNESSDELNYFKSFIFKRLYYFQERNKLLQNIIKLSHLTEAIPLPFELILDIIEYLPNKDLDVFIKAFKSSESCN